MAVTLTELYARLRLGDGVTPPVPPVSTILAGLQTTGVLVINRYAPLAPEAIRDEVLVRFVGYLYETPPNANQRGALQNALVQSGGTALLDPYRSETSYTLDDSDGLDETPLSPSTGGTPSGGVTQAELAAEAEARLLGDVDNATALGTETAARIAGDATLQAELDALPSPSGAVDQTARDEAAAAQRTADANTTIIGASSIPNTLPTIGRYIENFVSGIQNAADAASGADAKAVAAQNTATAAGTAAGVADGKAVVADGKAVAAQTTATAAQTAAAAAAAAGVVNANAIGTEAQARADGDVALGARIDALTTGGGGGSGAGQATTVYEQVAELTIAPGASSIWNYLPPIPFSADVDEVVEIRMVGEVQRVVDPPTHLPVTAQLFLTLMPDFNITFGRVVALNTFIDNGDGEFFLSDLSPGGGGPPTEYFVPHLVAPASSWQREGLTVSYLSHTSGIRNLYLAGVAFRASLKIRNFTIQVIRAGTGGGGTVDQTARNEIAAVKTEIGSIPAPLTTVGAWITDLSQAVQLDADEEGTLNTKINGVNNALVDEVTTRTASDATFTEATGRNALHIADEVTARTAADVALGLRIDGITSPDYRPGLAPYKFVGSDRAAAVAAREEYFLGEVALSQSYTQIFSAGAASRIRVTLDDSVPTQVGAAGNSWNLVLGVDHNNDSVTIVPDTVAETFTLRLPAAGISLDQLANDLDSNSRLNAEVVGNGSSLVNYAATWGPNPVVGSTTPFGNGGNQSATERTAWRASYEADADLTITLDYEDREEIQHWDSTPADWVTVLTLIDPPLPIWSAGPSQNLFTGATRTAAIAARDLYSLRNTGAVQASRFLPLGTSPTVGVRVTLSADAGIGATGNGWRLQANGAAFAGSNSAIGYDLVQRLVGVDYNSANLTAESLAHLFNSIPGFSAELVGGISQTAIGFVAAQIAGLFSGGVDAAVNPRTVWISDYEIDDDLYITLSYGEILERQVRRNFQWAPVDTIQVPIPPPAGVHLLRHDNAAPGENFQWWANLTNAKNEYIERTGGSINMPEVGSQYLSIPSTNSIIYLRISDGANNIALVTLGHLILPDGSRVASQVTVMVGATPVTLTIESSGRVSGTQSAGSTVNTALDAWVQ